MILRALLFLSVALLVLGGATWFMARRTLALLPRLQAHSWVVWGIFALFVVLLFGVPLVHRLLPALDRLLTPFYWAAYLLFAFISTYVVYLLAADLVQVLARRLLGAPSDLGAWAAGSAIVLSALSVAAGLVTARRPPVMHVVEVPVVNLHPDLEGYRIVQISDLHLGPLVGPERVDQIVADTNALAPGLVAITGDLVDGEADGVRHLALRMAALRATHGVFFVTGNHEYYSGVDRWLELVRGMGWTVLHNEHRLLTHGQAHLAVTGMPDPTQRGRRGTEGPNLAKALAGIPPEAFRLLLFHPPRGVAEAAEAGVHLQLSGHTHAGQYFPWSVLVQALWTHAQGLSREGGLWIYTSRGTGFWGPPNRLFVPPELTLLVLRRAEPTAQSEPTPR